MEKTQGIGVVLLFLLLTGMLFLNAPSEEEVEKQQRIQDSIERSAATSELEAERAVQEIQASDSVLIAKRSEKFGDLSAYAGGQEEITVLENDQIKLELSNKGGYIKNVILKDFNKISDGPDKEELITKVQLLNDKRNKFEYLLPDPVKGEISTSDLFFETEKTPNGVKFFLHTDNGRKFEQTYTLNSSEYLVDYNILSQGYQNDKGLKLRWKNYLDKIEKNVNFEKYYATVYYKPVDDSSDYCSCRGDDTEELEGEKLEWVSHVHQFFNTSLISRSKPFAGTEMTTEMLPEEDVSFKVVSSTMHVPVDNGSPFSMQMYLGPNEFNILKGMDNGLEEIIPFGRSIFGTINRWIIRPSFNFLSKFIGSKGVVIIVLIFIIKMLLYPLTYKMLHSQAKMGALKPVVEKSKEKFKDEPQKAQMETMKVYREYGVSPLGGCMPMIVQMPIWYALFRFFPASITFRQESFLWANDLSSYDVIYNLPFTIPAFGAHISLFTILWAISTLIYTYYNTKHMDMSANPAMKYVQYMMPVMFLVFFNNYASGLTCYMFFSNLFNIIQTVVTKKYVFDDEKLRAELDIQKQKPKKKGGFQSRLEEAMKQQQELQKKQGKKK
jgi:YidC/Oxa1 family membrane protein insertase